MYENEMFAGWEIVGEPIGKGGFSKVYKIRKNDGMGGEYFSAMKVITIPATKEEYQHYVDDGYDAISISTIFRNQVTSLVNELKLLSQFRGNTNIVSYEDHKVVAQPDGYSWHIFIRMELLDTLPAVNNVSPLTVTDTVKLGIDICNAILLCEKKNVIHRDIKPQNIFVNKNGDYKLGDFGIAKTMDHDIKATRVGTPAYMAPEVYHGESYGSGVDIYSLGMVLYWLLNERRLPFLPLPPAVPTNSDTIEAQSKRLGGTPLPPPKNGTPALKDAVLKACAFDPNQRFRSAAALKTALEWVLSDLGGRPKVAPAPQPIPQPVYYEPAPQFSTEELQNPPKKNGTNGLLIALICLLLVVAVSGGVAAFLLFSGEEGREREGGDSSMVLYHSSEPESVYDYSEDDSSESPDDSSAPESSYDDSSNTYSGVSDYSYDDSSTAVPDFSYEVNGNVKYSGREGNLNWELYTDGTLVISGNGEMSDLSWYEDIAWAVHKDEIYRIIVKEGVTSIGAYAFSTHEKVKSISLPQSVKTLGLNSFRSCISVKELYIPSDVDFIAEDAFAFCTSLETINIPRGVKSIEKWLFGYCTSLKTIRYDGTTEEWRALPKGFNWFKDTKDFEVRCKNGVISHTISAGYTLAYSAYTVTLTDNGNGTATITAAVPAGVYSGKLVVSTGSDLSLVGGSLKGVGTLNEHYNEDGVSGACVTFASASALPNGEIVFSATYRIKDGAVLDFGDFGAPVWSLSKNGALIGTQNGSDVLKKLVK